MTTFKNPHDPDNRIITAKIQEWVRSVMKIEENAVVEIMELNCADPGCMDKETRIIIVNTKEDNKQFRIHKPLVFVRKPDIDHLMK